jgi:hypothetical protein
MGLNISSADDKNNPIGLNIKKMRILLKKRWAK